MFLITGTARAEFAEHVREMHFEPGVHAVLNSPAEIDVDKPTLLIIYATPNGNTIEQTLGCRGMETIDWHYDIQHIAAQVRKMRDVDRSENIAVAVVQPDEKSWPAWRAKHADNGRMIRDIVHTLASSLPGKSVRVALTAHSGGGSFITGYINGGETIDSNIARIAYLDANYSYSDSEHHGDKLLTWLKDDPKRQLVVIAYDDRNVKLNGKPIVSKDGGTYRASHRMIDRFSRDLSLQKKTLGDFETWTDRDQQVHFFIRHNPENRILHTVLVGDMNGLIEAIAIGTSWEKQWGGTFGGPRAYENFIEQCPPPATTQSQIEIRKSQIPPRANGALGGHPFLTTIAPLPPLEWQLAVEKEISAGNIPSFLLKWKDIHVTAAGHHATYFVMPDYLSIGSDADFVRIPLWPKVAQRIADRFGCILTTQKICDDVYRAAELKLEPRPLTEKREAPETFLQHHEIIEEQRKGKPLGLLVAGIKKDIVITNCLKEQPRRVAIYGWHKLDGNAIQPLTIVHRETYVDYSHGARLVKGEMIVDGKPMNVRDILRNPELSAFLSDEGPIDAKYH